MAQLLTRLRSAVRSLGNEGALANIEADRATALEVRRAIDLLEVRMQVAAPVVAPRAA